jgi:hypothetical protein
VAPPLVKFELPLLLFAVVPIAFLLVSMTQQFYVLEMVLLIALPLFAIISGTARRRNPLSASQRRS